MAKAKTQDMVSRMSEELKQLDSASRARVIEGVLDDFGTIDPDGPIFDLCGLLFAPTAFENDLQTIVDRTSISARIENITGNQIDVGETFDIVVNVRNCTGWGLRDVRLTATNTGFARVNGTNSASFGDLANRQAAPAQVFTCVADTATPTDAPNVADTLINLSVSAVVDLDSRARTTRKSVQGEIDDG